MFGQIFDDLVPISFLEENSFLSGMLDSRCSILDPFHRSNLNI
jgi:hypothetical protein